ncbi:PASTA domain-containing protein, partial [Bacillus sp. SIMBA_074]|uniref:PASTA domain-containing protein n=1 Tax=Bacillus sp. SIMBA_074 TaxID=3085812 RepID=UPI00397860E7
GMVSSTDPGAGAPAGRGSTVTLRISQGPKPVTIPALAGQSVDAAKSAITGVGAKVGDIAQQFDAKVPANTVISATRADNGADIINVSISQTADSADLRAAVEHASAVGALVVA